MEFRKKIESIMTEANLTEDDKNLLMEVLRVRFFVFVFVFVFLIPNVGGDF